MSDYTGNLVAAGVRRRRVGGFVGLVAAIVVFVALVLTNAPRAWRLVLILPLFISAVGFFQASEKTCVALGAAGIRELEGGGTCPLREDERGAVAAHITRILIQSVIVAAVVTAIAYWV
ncbi:MAG TPA: hypothetical protein VGM67_13535 [Gemmatimonadaceae bacterium]|jgi:hypothetical protein